MREEETLEHPALSIVIVSPDTYESIRKTIKHLRLQSVSHKTEIIIVAPSEAELKLDPAAAEGFFALRVIEVGQVASSSHARAAGIRVATAPIVALVEDHTYQAPGWCEAMLERHREGWAAVGPAMVNANPRGAISWANLLIEYSDWAEPISAGERDHLPGHNSSYKREVLLDYGSKLEEMLVAESVLHWDLRAKGHKLYLEPKARTFHLNFSSPFSWMPLRFQCGRMFAGERARGWSPLRRLLYAGASPLIPFVRLRRIADRFRSSGRPRHLRPSRALPITALALVVDAAGEMAGYAFGGGSAAQRVTEMEFHRQRNLSKRDRRDSESDATATVGLPERRAYEQV